MFLLITTMTRKGQYFTPRSAYLIWVADAAVLIIAVCPTFYTPCISFHGNFWCWNRFVDLALNYLQISYNYWCVFLFVRGLFLLVVVLVLVVDLFFCCFGGVFLFICFYDRAIFFSKKISWCNSYRQDLCLYKITVCHIRSPPFTCSKYTVLKLPWVLL